jgi:Spherulation-specific family 4
MLSVIRGFESAISEPRVMISTRHPGVQRALWRCLVAFSVLSILALSSTAAGASAAAGPPGFPAKMVVPMYTNPTALWPSISSAGPAVGVVILNPAVAQRFNYSAVLASFVETAQASGLEVLGYVPTDYDNGVVPLSYAETLMSDYASWYHVDGFFVDEVNTTCLATPLAYYTSISQFAKQQSGSDIVAMNLGGDAGSCYMNLANIFVTFENTYSAYLTASPPSWAAGLPSSDFMNIVYDTPSVAAMQNTINLAVAMNVGLVYVTDLGSSGNPYSGLPTFMAQEAAYLDSLATVQAQPVQTTSTLSISALNSAGTALPGYYVTLWQGGVEVGSCFSSCSFTVNGGQTYQVTAASFGGEAFSYWLNDGATGVETVSVPTLSTTLSLTAVYTP